jgi:hypothetical protein
VDRPIYKFRYKEMGDVAEAFAKFLQALFSSSEISEKTAEELVNKSIKGLSLLGSLKSIANFASVVIPAGLRLSAKEKETVPPEETMKYLPEIMKVNKGFFYELLQGLPDVIDVVLTFSQKETPTSLTPKEELVRKS